ncbi:MAG TPA: peptide-binding protein [Bacillota bacterium]|nr:peptide-binding protein [Bacillota bacterium]
MIPTSVPDSRPAKPARHPSGPAAVAGLLAGAMLLAACGGAASTSTSATSGSGSGGGSTTATTQSAASGAAASTKNDLIIGFGGDATTLNPVIATDGQSYEAEWPIFDSLVTLTPDLKPAPGLATSWDVSQDGLHYTFHLRQGVKWQDGQPFTASDVVFTIDQILNPKVNTPNRPFFSALAGFSQVTNAKDPVDPNSLKEPPVQAIDPNTVQFNLSKPYSPLLLVLSDPRADIVPEHLLKGQDMNTAAFNTHPVGTGPFEFVSWQKNSQIVLKANPNYWGGKPQINEIIYRIIPDPTTAVQALKSGEINFLEAPPLDQLASLKQDPRFQVLTGSTVSYEYFGFVLTNPLFADVRVRQAFNYAINVQQMIKDVLLGYATQAAGQFPPSSWAADPSVQPYPYDPTKAKQLLAAAGWTPGAGGILQKNGQPLQFSCMVNQADNQAQQAATIIQADLQQIGVKMTINQIDWPTEVKNLFAANYQSTVVGWTNMADPDPFAYTIWDSTQWKGRNFAHFSDPKIDQLIEQGRSATTLAARQQAYYQFDQVLKNDAPYVFLWYPEQVFVVGKQFQGLQVIPVQGGIFQSLAKVTIGQ